jgi:hypothetical protein
LTNQPCPTCTKLIQGAAAICSGCANHLTLTLLRVPAVVADLEITLAREDVRRSTSGGGGDDGKPLPFHVGAGKAHDDLKAILVSWARLVSEEREWFELAKDADGKAMFTEDGPVTIHHATTDLTCADTGPSIARWLALYVQDWLAYHPAAPEAHDEIMCAIQDARAAVDIPEEVVLVGVCRQADKEGIVCTARLYAETRAKAVVCPACGTAHSVKSRQQQALAAAEDKVLTLTQITRGLTRSGVAISQNTVRSWVRRGKLEPAYDKKGHTRRDTRGVAMYRVGDVLDLYAEWQASPYNYAAARDLAEQEQAA